MDECTMDSDINCLACKKFFFGKSPKFSIFDKYDEGNKSYAEKIQNITGLNFEAGDEIYLCTKCRDELIQIYVLEENFAKKCLVDTDITFTPTVLVPPELQAIKIDKDLETSLVNSEPAENEKKIDIEQNSDIITDQNLFRVIEERRFKCKTCGSKFKNEGRLKTHLDNIHNTICKFCNKKFHRHYIKDHLNTHTGDKPHKCKYCQSTFNTRGSLSHHRRNDHGLHGNGEKINKVIDNMSGYQQFICTICNMTFKHNSSLMYHIRRHNGDIPLKCDECPTRFFTKSKLKAHKRTHTGVRPHKCHICGMTYTRNWGLEYHYRSHDGIEPEEINYLLQNKTESKNNDEEDKTVNVRENLILEVTEAATTDVKMIDEMPVTKEDVLEKFQIISSKLFKCAKCNKTFTDESKLLKHMGRHKPIKCMICEKSLKGSGFLKKHMKMHETMENGKKKFECNICLKILSRISYRNHYKTHKAEREKSFKCDKCQKAFFAKSALKLHYRNHTGERPFKCNICSMAFIAKGILKGHMLVHTGEKPFSCDICQKNFRRKQHLRDHKALHDDKKTFQKSISQISLHTN